LALVRTLTTLHGGSVSAYSEGLGRGSEFTVRLPASAALPREAAPATRGAQPTAPRRRSRRILIVDDNEDAAEMLFHLLVHVGHDVRVANDPSEALSMAGELRPEVAILDIGLPVMDGYALGRELRARLGDVAPIMIALTGYGQESDRRRSEEAGFALHFVKPVDSDTLIGFIDDIVDAQAERARAIDAVEGAPSTRPSET
jgi:CheY-like chemotaxis protein